MTHQQTVADEATDELYRVHSTPWSLRSSNDRNESHSVIAYIISDYGRCFVYILTAILIEFHARGATQRDKTVCSHGRKGCPATTAALHATAHRHCTLMDHNHIIENSSHTALTQRYTPRPMCVHGRHIACLPYASLTTFRRVRDQIA